MQGLVKIRNDVVDILDAHRYADHSISNANRLPPFLAQGGMRHGGGMRDQGLYSA
jgi:hypothetical protein